MEAATAPESVQDLNLSPNPTLFLDTVNYLDTQDPIDQLLAGYKEVLDSENFPRAARQYRLIDGLKNGDLQSARALINSHQGLIAAVAYPFKHGKMNAKGLLHQGTHALVVAAKSYNKQDAVDFTDYAAAAVHAAFSDAEPALAGDSFIELPQRPMESVYQFVGTLRVARTVSTREAVRQRAKQLESERTDREEAMVLRHLLLPTKEIVALTGLSIDTVRRRIRSAQIKLHAETREEAAVMAMNQGVAYTTLPVPAITEFSIRQRMVAVRAVRTNKAIAKELGLTERQVSLATSSLTEKIGARSRTELAVMAHQNNFEPTASELTDAPPKGLEEFSPIQREVLQLLYLPYGEIAERLGASKNIVKHAVHKACDKVDLHNRTALIVELYNRGVEFEVVEPQRPLSELLNAEEMKIAELSHLSYGEIADIVGLSQERIAHMMDHARNKVQAKTRPELAVIVRKYDTGERREKDTRSREEKLAAKIGLTAINIEEIQALFANVTPRQREFVTAYYLDEEQLSWRGVAERLGVTRGTALSIAFKGIERMRAGVHRDGIS